MKPFHLPIWLSAALLAFAAPVTAQSWTQPHANAAADGFVDVPTAPAIRVIASKAGLGSFAPGVGPVVGANGLVIFGNTAGRVYAFGNVANPKWTLDLPGKGVISPAVLGTDQSIYVIGARSVRDHRAGAGGRLIGQMTMNKINPQGQLVWSFDFPEQKTGGHSVGAGLTSAAPVLARIGGRDVIFIPVHLPGGGHHVQLVVWDSAGSILFNQQVTNTDDEGGDAWYCWFGFCKPEFNVMATGRGGAAQLPLRLQPPTPGAAFAHIGNDDWVVVSDGWHNVVGYTFVLDGGFVEKFRRKDNDRQLSSGPAILPDGHSVFGVRKGRIGFAGPNAERFADINQWDNIGSLGNLVLAPPARTAAGLVVAVGKDFGVAVIEHVTPKAHLPLPADTIAGASVSRNHIFVSTVTELLTYDAVSFDKLGSFAWSGGGLSTPAIGDGGRVFALAGDTLYVFAPPVNGVCRGVTCGRGQPGRPRPPVTRTP